MIYHLLIHHGIIKHHLEWIWHVINKWITRPEIQLNVAAEVQLNVAAEIQLNVVAEVQPNT